MRPGSNSVAPREHQDIVAALLRRWGRCSDYERGVLVACEVDVARGPLPVERVAWLRALAERLGVDLQTVSAKVLDFGPVPKRPG